MVPTVKSNRSELALLRGKTTAAALEEWTRAFGKTEQYQAAITAFLGAAPAPGGEGLPYIGSLSPETRKAYSYTLEEFFEWLAASRGRPTAPPDVTIKDAEDYAAWLATRPFSLLHEKLRDGDRSERLALFDAVTKLGSADIHSIAESIPDWLKKQWRSAASATAVKADLAQLHRELGRMVTHDLLTRTPTFAELRKTQPRLGIDEFVVQIPEGDKMRDVPMEYVFEYSIPKPRAVGRATIALRIGALSSFWDVLTQGDNRPGGEPLVRHNVFRPILKRVLRGRSFEKKQARVASNQVTAPIVDRLLSAAAGPSLVDKRNAALVWFIVLMAGRASEVITIRRGKPASADEQRRWPGWLDGAADPPGVWLRRKGGKMQWLPFPPIALEHLHTFQVELARRAAPPEAQKFDPDGPHYVHPDSPRWRYQLLTTRADSPLFPPVHFWGANSTSNYEELKPNLPNTAGGTDYRKSMSRHTVAKILKRLAEKAGLSEDELRKVHPHAVRSFSATAMAREGKSLREVQAILGHDSLLTTEGYIADEERPVALSGQTEIMRHLAGARPEGAPPAPLAEPSQPVREAVGVAVRQAPPSRSLGPQERRERREPTPAGAVPDAILARLPDLGPIDPMPAQSPALAPPAEIVHETGKGPMVEIAGEPVPPAAIRIEEGVSPGSPFEVYEALEPSPAPARERLRAQEHIQYTRPYPRQAGEEELRTLYQKRGRDQVQRNRWLRDHYDPWPLHYGLGEQSLLPWFARGNPDANGEVQGNVFDPETGKDKVVRVPPLPVLSPDQVYPETADPRALFVALDRMQEKWLTTEPSRVFGLRRWFATFAYVTAELEKATGGEFQWVPFDGAGKLGEHIRAHDDEYIAKWFLENSGRFATTMRLFRQQISSKEPAEYAADFQRIFGLTSYASASTVQDIPEWFASDDPVRAIYDESPEEWQFFLTWIQSVTGAKLTKARKGERDEQVTFTKEKRAHDIERARELLETYFSLVAELTEAIAEGQKDDAARMRLLIGGGSIGGKPYEGLTEQLQRLGVADPKKYAAGREEEGPREIAARTERILKDAFPEAPVELVDPNMLRSRMFDPEAFRIDPSAHTISHSPAFRESFAEAHEGMDSECVMRRAARGMWEYVKRNRLTVERGKKRASEYSMLHAIMLTYTAWIVPCPRDIEAAMAEHTVGRLSGERARSSYLLALNRAVRDAVSGEPDRTEEEILSDAAALNLPAQEAMRALEIAQVYAATLAEHQIPIEQAVASAIARGEEELATRPRRGRLLRRNLSGRRVLFHEPGERCASMFGCQWTGKGLPRKDAAPEIYLSPNAYRHGVRLVRNAERLLPSPLHMIAAMLTPLDGV